MPDNIESIDVLYRSLSAESKEQILLYAKLIAAGEANARKADAPGKENAENATAR